ncbi:hypothetical protein HYH02_011959 [Chlamydomonas schloesseri]|uniref:EF-hand domain-containing protein n=1 Tax=Chlamydomonas schloesseri TaxID=2026947 RepID=A0A835SYD0_9CHLO|nr:hypothetical protein HYH02_011959 [Chlamydomonas schloesseri]|eukprot:KAG2435459.1 hypothetical protein HYH02_011959 [Chlamydomonas schloesseri]
MFAISGKTSMRPAGAGARAQQQRDTRHCNKVLGVIPRCHRAVATYKAQAAPSSQQNAVTGAASATSTATAVVAAQPRPQQPQQQQQVLSAEQQHFSLERVSGFSRVMVRHIFEEVDADGSGALEAGELWRLGQQLGEEWDASECARIFAEIDTDHSGEIMFDEFYAWFVAHCKAEDETNKVLSRRATRLNLGLDSIPPVMLDLLALYGTDQIKQECTHPLHSGHGRMLRDHLISTYLLLKQWGNSDTVCAAGMFHAIYERADGMQACDWRQTRPLLQGAFGKEVEELIYLFPSAHASIYKEDGLLHAPLGRDFTLVDFGTKETITFPDRLRAAMCELEFVNGYDQSFLEDQDAVQNMWAYYQHANILPLLSKEAQRIVMRYRKLGEGATVKQICDWHEGRFRAAGKDIDADRKWGPHIKMFRQGGRYDLLEKKVNEIYAIIDENGDGDLQLPEFNKLVQALDLQWSEEQVAAKFMELDRSGDGGLDRFEADLWFIPLFNQRFLMGQLAPQQ